MEKSFLTDQEIKKHFYSLSSSSCKNEVACVHRPDRYPDICVCIIENTLCFRNGHEHKDKRLHVIWKNKDNALKEKRVSLYGCVRNIWVSEVFVQDDVLNIKVSTDVVSVGLYSETRLEVIKHSLFRLRGYMDKFQEIPSVPPDGWNTKFRIAEKIGERKNFISRRCEDLKKKFPDLVKKYYAKNGTAVDHFSPKIFEIIQKEVEMFKTPSSEYWLNITSILATLHCSKGKFLQVMKEYKFRKKYPKWFTIAFNMHCKKMEFYHRGLVQKLKKEQYFRKDDPIDPKYLDVFGPPINRGKRVGPYPTADEQSQSNDFRINTDLLGKD